MNCAYVKVGFANMTTPPDKLPETSHSYAVWVRVSFPPKADIVRGSGIGPFSRRLENSLSYSRFLVPPVDDGL
jgi:hypothetical protein